MSDTTRRDIEQKAIEQAWKDPAFKQELLDDPRGALERSVDLVVPDGVTIKVVEETPDTIYFVLPMNPDAELSEAELDTVAGGIDSGPEPEDPGDGGDDPSRRKTTRGCLVRPNSRRCTSCIP